MEAGLRLEQTIYVPVGGQIPAAYTPETRIAIPSISREAIAGVSADLIDVTTLEDRWAEYIQSDMTQVSLRDGRSISLPSRELTLALNGGGDFLIAGLNPVHGPITFEEHQREEELDYSDDPDDYYY